MVDYILRIKNKALMKRFGWMLESLECNYVKKLQKQAYKTMIPLDITRPITGFEDKKWGIIVNIGGIANITSLPVSGSVAGFDCGPGNILMDAWCFKYTGMVFDRDGLWGRSGSVIPRLLENLLACSYFSLPPPKSTGRDLFNIDWLQSCLTGDEAAQDVQSTLLRLTSETIARAVLAYFPAAYEIYLCGGGARNIALVEQLQLTLLSRKIMLTDVLGIDGDWVEACAFAWLAQQAIEKIPGNLPIVTGAHGKRVLGGIYPA